MIPGNGWEALYAPVEDGVPDETGHVTRLPVIAWGRGAGDDIVGFVLGPVADGMQTPNLVEARYITPYSPKTDQNQRPQHFARYEKVG